MYEILMRSTTEQFATFLSGDSLKHFLNLNLPPFIALAHKQGPELEKFHRFLRLAYSGDVDGTFLSRMIKSLSDTIHRVISNSPATKKTMIVYRGVKDSFFTADNYTLPMNKNEVFLNKGFVSTSMLHTVSLSDFINLGSGCCFKVITVLPGTKCVPLLGLSQFNQEFEILLNRDTKYIIRDKYVAKVPVKELTAYNTNAMKFNNIKVSEIIVG